MATFYTRPDITTRGQRPPEDVNDLLSRYMQLTMLAQDRSEARQDRSENRRTNALREKEATLRLKEIERAASEGQAVRGAYAAGVRPGGRMEAMPGVRGGPVGSTNIPTTVDRNAILSELARSAPQMVPQQQAQFAGQDAEMQKQRQEWENLSTTGKIKRIELESKKIETIGQLAGGVRDEATKMAALQRAVQLGAIDEPTAQKYAAQPFSPEWIDGIRNQALTAKEQLDAAHQKLVADETKRHNEEMEKPGAEREFQAFYKPWLEAQGITKKNAALEMKARKEFEQRKRAPKGQTAHERRAEEDTSVEQTAGDYLGEAKGDPDGAVALLNQDERDPKVSEDLRRLAARIRQRIRDRARKTGKRDRLGDILNPQPNP